MIPDGALCLDKPEGPTSHDLVAQARRLLGQPRIGHAGTLDPLATGLLVLLLHLLLRLLQGAMTKLHLRFLFLLRLRPQQQRLAEVLRRHSPTIAVPTALSRHKWLL